MNEHHVRSWRVTFASLRDAVDSGIPSAVEDLLLHSRSLVVASSHVAPEEVAADIIFLVQSVSSQPEFLVHINDEKSVCEKVCCLVMDVSSTADLRSVPSYGPSVLRFIVAVVETQFLEDTKVIAHPSSGTKIQRSFLDSLQALGKVIHNFGEQLSPSDVSKVCILLLNFIKGPNVCKGNVQAFSQNKAGGSRVRDLEIQRSLFVALVNVLSQCRSSISRASYVEILKALKDYLEFTTRGGVVEDSKSSRLYSGILRCLQLVISDMNGPIGEFVGPLVTCIVTFFDYGLHVNLSRGQNMQTTSEISIALESKESSTTKAKYKPPHLRKAVDKISTFNVENNAGICNEQSHSLRAVSRPLLQSDSEQSDSDGSLGDGDRFNSAKVRMLAVLCTQELARVDPKSVHAYWIILFPTNDVLNNRRVQNSLLKTLLYDPILKVRMAAAATLSLMLEGPSRAFMQIAEYKEAGKFGSFVTLSYSLGQVLVQLHRGLSYMISNEPNIGLLVASLKAFSLFIGAAPFTRLPLGMLPDTIQALQKRLKDLLSAADQTNAPCMIISCLGCALNTVPSEQVSSMLVKDIRGDGNTLLQDLFYCVQTRMPLSVQVEALETLKLAVHNYPMVMIQQWTYISPVIRNIVKCKVAQDVVGHSHNTEEKFVLAAVKLLNELLRTASGSSLTDDAADEPSLHSSHSSFPSSSALGSNENTSHNDRSETVEFSCWSESLQEYLPILVSHPSAVVRAEAVTCFAGLTQSVFVSLPENGIQFVISTVLEMAANDASPAARSAASRAIGVIISYPTVVARVDILVSTVDILVRSTKDTSIVVRITASWALANLCDALWFLSEDERLGNIFSSLLRELAECAMGLAKDNDKVRANAVRALGNLARFMKFNQENADATRLGLNDGPIKSERSEETISGSYPWLEKVLQTFVSCVTTGNVKVQWNVCHALGNLFLNKSIVLSKMKWVASVFSILLLLLRDSKNFKIRIQAALALAAPETRSDYCESYYDVIQALVLALDTLDLSAELAPPGFKYVKALRDQLTSTCIHILALASPEDCQVLRDFFIKHASFFEGWLRSAYAAINANDVFDQLLKSEITEGRSGYHLTKHKMCNERLPRERTWYAFNDKDPLLCKESSVKRQEVKRVAESLINVYKDENHTNLVAFLEQLLSKCSPSNGH